MPKPTFFSQTSLLFLLLLFLNCQPKNQNAKPTPADENQLIRVTAKDIHALVKNAEHEIVLVNVLGMRILTVKGHVLVNLLSFMEQMQMVEN